jgi:hypothetical protein
VDPLRHRASSLGIEDAVISLEKTRFRDGPPSSSCGDPERRHQDTCQKIDLATVGTDALVSRFANRSGWNDLRSIAPPAGALASAHQAGFGVEDGCVTAQGEAAQVCQAHRRVHPRRRRRGILRASSSSGRPRVSLRGTLPSSCSSSTRSVRSRRGSGSGKRGRSGGRSSGAGRRDRRRSSRFRSCRACGSPAAKTGALQRPMDTTAANPTRAFRRMQRSSPGSVHLFRAKNSSVMRF